MLEFKEFNLTYKNGKVLSLSHNKKINVQTLNKSKRTKNNFFENSFKFFLKK